MIDDSTIRLRPWREDDIPVLMSLRNDVALQAKLLSRARGSSASDVRSWLNRRSGEVGNLFFVVADLVENAALGFVQCSGLDSDNRNVDLGICLVPQAQGHGIGGQALVLAASHLRSVCSMRKISLRVRIDSEAAIRCYLRVGFAPCGILRAHVFVDSAWRDVMLLEQFLEPNEPT